MIDPEATNNWLNAIRENHLAQMTPPALVGSGPCARGQVRFFQKDIDDGLNSSTYFIRYLMLSPWPESTEWVCLPLSHLPLSMPWQEYLSKSLRAPVQTWNHFRIQEDIAERHLVCDQMFEDERQELLVVFKYQVAGIHSITGQLQNLNRPYWPSGHELYTGFYSAVIEEMLEDESNSI